MSKKFDILERVEFLDKVRIHVYRAPPEPGDPRPIRIEFQSLQKGKKVIFDENALKTMNNTLTEKAKQFEPEDPRLLSYVEEFAGRLTEILYKNGLVELVEIPDQPEDHYATIRKQFSRQ